LADGAREQILSRIRQALVRPAPEPHGWHEDHSTGPAFPLPATLEECRSRFRQEFEAIHGEWYESSDLGQARVWLEHWRQEHGLTSSIAVDHPLVRELVGDEPATEWIDDHFDPRGAKDVPLGISPCESLVAESGSIVVSTALSGRASTILPPVHLVVARPDQLVPDIETSMARLRERYGKQLPSSISWITGPSRTADIEKILVLGAHGPRRLALLIVG
jgi:L-lactate dehydrogenase complex protein LldG